MSIHLIRTYGYEYLKYPLTEIQRERDPMSEL